MNDFKVSLAEARITTALDENIGFWQDEIDERDREETDFTSHHGRYQFTRMSFGLKKEIAAF